MNRRAFLGLTLTGSVLYAQRSQALQQSLLAEFDKLELVNTHEHILPEAERTSQPVDFFTLAGHYAINDVVSAGLTPESLALVNNREAPLDARWAAFEPHWKNARFTGYSQALRIAVRDLYGFDISGANLPKINAAISERNKPGLYRDVLKKRARIQYSVNDEYWNPRPSKVDPEFFVLARKFDNFVTPSTPVDLERLSKLTGVSVTSLSGLKQAMERMFEQSVAAGMVTVKSTIAYNRELRFEEVPAADAEADFEALAKGSRPLPEAFRRNVNRPFRRLEDHMFHHLVRLADSHRVPFQVHTGLHAGNGNFITNSNPTGLTNLFHLYPRVKFDLFHISYPYQGELAVLAKLFPNVYVDFCWAHIISPAVSRRALSEFLEAVPANKIFGFGGDYRYPELSYAHAKMARRNIAETLSEKVQEGFCSETEAAELGKMMLHSNPAAVFVKRS